MLINNYEERQKRTRNNELRILRFLRDETWSSAKIISILLNQSLSGAYKVLNRMISLEYITSYKIEDLNLSIYGITTLGLMMSYDNSEEVKTRACFQRSRVKAVMVRHHLMLQQARIQAEKSGWADWTPGNLLPIKLAKRPDAIAENPGKKIICIELERTMKTRRRYEKIKSLYLQKIRVGDYDSVHYIVPDKKFSVALKRMFKSISHIPVVGEKIKLTEAHRKKFEVHVLDCWPNNLKELIGE